MGTNNIIDMAAGAAILKEQMITQLHVKDILTVAPTTIKKFAGKGNMNKLQLFEAYQQNVNDDPILARSPLHSMVKDLEIGKKIPKPLDDLVSGYIRFKPLDLIFPPDLDNICYMLVVRNCFIF